MSKKSPWTPSTASIQIIADGVIINAYAEANGDTHLKIDDQEEIIMSPTTATVLGLMLTQLAKPEE